MIVSRGSRGRYAPSPTGAIHLGNARTALLAWLDARAAGGAFVMRVEDLDRARVLPGAEAALLADLRWLGIDWDEGPGLGEEEAGRREGAGGGPFAPYRQSERTARYDAAVEALLASGAAFLCACSRADVARAASAPHPGDADADADADGPRYPGTCRDRHPGDVRAQAAAQGRRPAVRFRGGGTPVDFVDLLHGAVAGDPRGVDDFVLRRADGTAAYQLAVVVDDAAMRIDRVVRADDLLTSTPRQLALYGALGATPPSVFAHVPLVLAPGGERLAKRRRPVPIAALRARGVAPEAIVGLLAASAGLCPHGTRVAARDLVPGFHLAAIERGAPVIDPDAAFA